MLLNSKHIIKCCLVLFFVQVIYAYPVGAEELTLYKLPKTAALAQGYIPVIISGLRLNPSSTNQIEFIVNKGQESPNEYLLKQETLKLVKYFMAGLTVPDDQLWVNLSPYEKDRIIADGLSQTDMGRDMLAQDYLLKQMSSAMTNPENSLGKKFWDEIFKQIQAQYPGANVPVNMFNKIWIVPDKASVYVNGDTVLVVENHLKVMVEEDYVASQKDKMSSPNALVGDLGRELEARHLPEAGYSGMTSKVIRDIILPELEREVNTAKNFSPVRQIFNSMILAIWYKKNLKERLFQEYINKNKIAGISIDDQRVKERIYQAYLRQVKQGAYNFIKELPSGNGKVISRKYFSGGIVAPSQVDTAMIFPVAALARESRLDHAVVAVQIDRAMATSPKMDRRTFMQLLGGAAASAASPGAGQTVVAAPSPTSASLAVESIAQGVSTFLKGLTSRSLMDVYSWSHDVYHLGNYEGLVGTNFGQFEDFKLDPFYKIAEAQDYSDEGTGLWLYHQDLKAWLRFMASKRNEGLAALNDFDPRTAGLGFNNVDPIELARNEGKVWDQLSEEEQLRFKGRVHRNIYTQIMRKIRDIDRMKEFHQRTLESIRRDPYAWKMAPILEEYFRGGINAIKFNPLFKEFKDTLYTPSRNILNNPNFPTKEDRDKEELRIYQLWKSQREKWAKEYRLKKTVKWSDISRIYSSAGMQKTMRLVFWRPIKGQVQAVLLAKQDGRPQRFFVDQELVSRIAQEMPIINEGKFLKVTIDVPMTEDQIIKKIRTTGGIVAPNQDEDTAMMSEEETILFIQAKVFGRDVKNADEHWLRLIPLQKKRMSVTEQDNEVTIRYRFNKQESNKQQGVLWTAIFREFAQERKMIFKKKEANISRTGESFVWSIQAEEGLISKDDIIDLVQICSRKAEQVATRHEQMLKPRLPDPTAQDVAANLRNAKQKFLEKGLSLLGGHNNRFLSFSANAHLKDIFDALEPEKREAILGSQENAWVKLAVLSTQQKIDISNLFAYHFFHWHRGFIDSQKTDELFVQWLIFAFYKEPDLIDSYKRQDTYYNKALFIALFMRQLGFLYPEDIVPILSVLLKHEGLIDSQMRFNGKGKVGKIYRKKIISNSDSIEDVLERVNQAVASGMTLTELMAHVDSFVEPENGGIDFNPAFYEVKQMQGSSAGLKKIYMPIENNVANAGLRPVIIQVVDLPDFNVLLK